MIRELFERLEFRRFARHSASILLLMCALGTSLASAQGDKPSGNPSDQQNNQDAIQHQRYEQQIEALTKNLEALRDVVSKGQTKRPDENQYWWKAPTPPVWSNWMLAVIATLAGVVAYKGFTDQRDAVRLTQRADVLIDGVKLVNPILGDGQIPVWGGVIDVVFKNFGHTRAADFQVTDVALEIGWGDGRGDKTVRPGKPLPPQPVANGHHVKYRTPRLEEFFDRSLTATIGPEGNGNELRFLCHYRYTDVFGKVHKARLLARYRHDHNGFSIEHPPGGAQ